MNEATEDKELKSTSLRISKELSAKIAVIADQLPGMSINSFGVSCVEAILTMLETPKNQRLTPAIVLMVDSVRSPGPILTPERTPASPAKETIAGRLAKKGKESLK